MGYFPNSTSGEMYEEEFCNHCIHFADGAGCAVWNAHLLRNYDECNNKDSILHLLIPMAENGVYNEKCKMFLDESLLSPLGREKFKSERA